MIPANKLTAIKVLHTAIWVVMAGATAYAVTASLRGEGQLDILKIV